MIDMMKVMGQLDYNRITDDLLVGVTPAAMDYAKLKDLGVRLVINMRAEKFAWPTRPRRLIRTIWVPSLDSKWLPIKAMRLVKAVRLAVATIDQGGKVYVYCRAGRHRSVLMAAAILIAQSHSVDSAVAVLKRQRLVADPEIPHIYRVIIEFADLWQSQ